MTTAVDLGATPTTARALAPDLARGGMLLLIALANVHLFLFGHPLGVRGYPLDPGAVDQIVAVLQVTFVDGRAYPLFGLLFGYGIGQLTRRRTGSGLATRTVTRLVRRRGAAMIAIGLAHGTLLWSGDIIGAYGLLAVLMAGLLVRGSDRALLLTAGIGVLLTTLANAWSGLPAPGNTQAFLLSMMVPDTAIAMLVRAREWAVNGFASQAIVVVAAVALGAWAARRRILDEPERHRALLVRVAVVGLAVAVLAGLPLALIAGQVWTSPQAAATLLAGSLHALGGYAGGVGYAALFGLLAIRLAGRDETSPLTHAVRACGQRSLSCYLAQSVVFVALLPAWTLGFGGATQLWQATLLGAGTWAAILVLAGLSDRAGYRGPAEVLLRRLTYGSPHRQAAAPVRSGAAS